MQGRTESEGEGRREVVDLSVQDLTVFTISLSGGCACTWKVRIASGSGFKCAEIKDSAVKTYCSAVKCSAVQCSKTHCRAVQCSAIPPTYRGREHDEAHVRWQHDDHLLPHHPSLHVIHIVHFVKHNLHMHGNEASTHVAFQQG